MSNTRQQILALGEELIRTRGYHGFSYRDISQKLDIKNAAVHYHFVSKESLGLAIIEASISSFKDKEEEWDALKPKDQLLEFVKIYEKSHDNNWSCLMGALSSSLVSLPNNMQNKLSELAGYILDRLTKTLEVGKKGGAFKFPEEPRAKAQLIISSLLSSLMLDRVVEENIFDSIVESIITSVESHK